MIIYKDVLMKLKKAGYSSYRLRKNGLLSERTLQNIREGKAITTSTLDCICRLTKLPVEEIIEFVPEDAKNA